MAARKRKIRHDESTRAKIQATQLVRRLQFHILGKADPANPIAGIVEMTSTQVQAALGLLRKVLPDLASQQIEHSGEVAIERIERVIVDDRPVIVATDTIESVSHKIGGFKRVTH